MPGARGRSRSWWSLLPVLLVGCGEGAPPLDELPLRDALRADPQVVAAMPEAARRQLGERLEAASAADQTSDAVDDASVPAALVTALDEARARRQADAFVIGTVAAGMARPIPATGATEPTPLPDLKGEVATTTARIEARALAGAAGAALRALRASSGAQRLERVIGWPAGAVAIGDTVYVDAAWLVALAPDRSLDAGAADGETTTPGSSPPAGDTTPMPAVDAGTSVGVDAGAASSVESVTSLLIYNVPDAGSAPRQPPPPPPSSSSFWDECSAGFSADDCGDSSDDDANSCDGSTTTDDSGDSCSGGTTDDGASDCSSTVPDDGSDCRVAPGRGKARASTLVWVLAPLGYLVGRRR